MCYLKRESDLTVAMKNRWCTVKKGREGKLQPGLACHFYVMGTLVIRQRSECAPKEESRI